MKKASTFLLGAVVGITLTAGTTIGAANYLKATPKKVSIVVGSNQNSVEAMNVQNKLYVPVRDAGDSFGYSVSGVTSTTVTFAEGKTATTNSVGTGTTDKNTTTPSKTEGEYVEGLHDKYGTNGKLDAEKVKAAIAAGEISVNAQDKGTGNSLLHYVVLENNFAVYSVIKVNALNVNLQNGELQTPLILSVIHENGFYEGELTNYYKSDATIKDNSGKQAIDYSKPNSSTYINLKFYMM
ncbi:hypothetical protein [Paenibacillus donghaensis]|uniref:Copper amine oxidase-like N-terminal domain-containing protein n=1 Tax=Paenibacillus donghaensis TaxID=414771 RepID=A0A2Z2KFB6_9BACL|nr:hypothetical protein [Paenibacillus donghaensis]ASA21813.1 hypothetical protein B9T62_14145 [Paenibacillus donghaensis]